MRSLSLEVLAENESHVGVNRCNTLRCYPAKVPELIQSCCDYLEKNGKETFICFLRKISFPFFLALQTVGLFRVGVSKKRLKEVRIIKCQIIIDLCTCQELIGKENKRSKSSYLFYFYFSLKSKLIQVVV